MSGFILPVLPGQMLTQRKTPDYTTHRQRALSGKESRISYRAYPLYEWELQFEYLSDDFSLAPTRLNFEPYSQDATQWIVGNSGAGFQPIVVGSWFGSTAPDGTYTADRVIMNRGSGTGMSQTYQNPAPALIGTVATSSIWLKTNDGSTVTVILFFDGGIAPPSSGIFCTVTPTWQRFTGTGHVGSPGGYCGLRIDSLFPSTAAYADLSVWGAQLELGTLATPYIMTNGTAVRQSDLKTLFGFISQMLGSFDTFLYQDPQFNTVTLQPFATGNASQTSFQLTATYKPGISVAQFGLPAPVLGITGTPEWIQNTNGPPAIYTARYGAPELLSSSGRTNLALQSNFVTSWTATNTTLTAAAAVAPDGTTTAAQLTDTTTNGGHTLNSTGTFTIVGGSKNTLSFFVKDVSQQWMGLILGDNTGTNGVSVNFDLVNGTFTVATTGTVYQSNADIQMVQFPNGWWRCSVSAVLLASITAVQATVIFHPNGSAAFFPGYAGTGSNSVDIWGMQLERSTQPTALIPTTTTTVTVGADYSLSALSTSGSVNTFQQVVFGSAPANNVQLLWSGSFFYRVRFSEDKMDFAQFMSNLWEAKKIAFEQVIL